MAIKHTTVTVGTAAVDLVSSVPDLTDRAVIERSLVVSNEGTVDVFLGGPGVSVTDYGLRLAAGGSMTLDLTMRDVLFAVAGAAGQVVRVLHAGV